MSPIKEKLRNVHVLKKKRPVKLAPHGTIGESLYILFGCNYNIQKLFRLINKFYHFSSKKERKKQK
jgi:hypothetical protein